MSIIPQFQKQNNKKLSFSLLHSANKHIKIYPKKIIGWLGKSVCIRMYLILESLEHLKCL